MATQEKHREWVDTQMPQKHFWFDRPAHYGLGGLQTNDDFANPPQAAHAASEYTDEEPGESMVRAIGFVLCVWCVVALALVALAVWQ